MIIAKLAIAALLLFGAVSVAGAMGVILTLLVTPADDYDRELEDREQLEYLEEWRRHHE